MLWKKLLKKKAIVSSDHTKWSACSHGSQAQSGMEVISTSDVPIPVTTITRGTIPQRVFQRDPANAPTEDIREKLFELEA